MNILITNDDSHRSPLLEIVVNYFSQFGDVSIVVPLHEQSWTGKCVTRFTPVHVHEIEVFGRKALAVDGKPADCVNLGIHNLLDKKPDLVVSGINAGFNIGLGFVLSSGTVGACFEANLAGIPAIAVSQAFDVATRNRYISDYMIEAERISVFEKHSRTILDKLTSNFFSDGHKKDFLSTPITWNINLPFNLTDSRTVVHVPLSKTRYGRCFAEADRLDNGTIRTFTLNKVEEISDPNPHADAVMVRSGVATLCPINIWGLSGESDGEIVTKVVSAL